MNAALDDDAALIRRCRQGDSAAFGLLVTKYQDPLFNGILRMVGNYQDAADIAQDVFLKAFRSIDSFRGSAAFYTWLYTIAVNTCISQRRSAKVRREHVPVATGRADQAEDPPACDPLPQDAAQNREECARVELAIKALPAEYRMVVVLKDIEGRNYSEIAAFLNCSLGTVKSRLFRARERLRETLG